MDDNLNKQTHVNDDANQQDDVALNIDSNLKPTDHELSTETNWLYYIEL